jgi:hypothetical protein
MTRGSTRLNVHDLMTGCMISGGDEDQDIPLAAVMIGEVYR